MGIITRSVLPAWLGFAKERDIVLESLFLLFFLLLVG